MGIYVTSLNPVGAAASDGRIKVGDRILKVDGHSLRGLENMEAASVLRNCGNPVKLVLCRKRLQQENGDPTQEEGVCVCVWKRKRGELLLMIFMRLWWHCVSTMCATHKYFEHSVGIYKWH